MGPADLVTPQRPRFTLILLGLVFGDARTHESTDEPGNSGFSGGV
jgi:hypothetical protein